MSLVIGIDCSTTGSKAVVFDTDGSELASGFVPLEFSTARDGHFEQDPSSWFSATTEAIRQAVATIDVDEIAAVAITCQRESFVMLGADDAPLRPAILWNDTRAADEVARYGNDEVHRISGKPPSTVASYYKLRWLAEHESGTVEQTASVMDVAGYLSWSLTGRRASSLGIVDSLGILDLRRGELSPELLDGTGLTADRFPQLVDTGAVIGGVTADAAMWTGLRPGTPVVAGVGDGQSAGLGANGLRRGVAYLSLGTGLAMGVLAPRYMVSKSFRTLAGPVPGSFVLETLLSSGAQTITWLKALFGTETSVVVEEQISRDACTVPAGSEGLLMLPYLSSAETPYWDAAARGAFIGLRPEHRAGHFYRAALEGIAYEVRLHLEGLIRDSAVPVEELIVTGGGARSSLWCQIIADVTGRTVTRCASLQVSALGAAMHAANAVRAHGDASLEETAARMSRYGRRFTPDTAANKDYVRWFETYRGIYPSLAQLFAHWPTAPDATKSKTLSPSGL